MFVEFSFVHKHMHTKQKICPIEIIRVEHFNFLNHILLCWSYSAQVWIGWVNFWCVFMCLCVYFFSFEQIDWKWTNYKSNCYCLQQQQNNINRWFFNSYRFKLFQIYFFYRIIFQFNYFFFNFCWIVLFFRFFSPFILTTPFFSCKRNVKCFLNQIRNTVQWNHHRIHHHT